MHTQDLLVAEAAIRSRVPVIFEQHYLQKHDFKKELVNDPFFKLAVVQSEMTRQSLIAHGMPADKVIWMHNGFERELLIRQPEEAAAWRRELLPQGERFLAVYSGTLFSFKGIDIIIEAAKSLPQVKFVLTGGTDKQLSHYRNMARDASVKNVEFLGWVEPRSRLWSLFQAADIMLHPHTARHGDYTSTVKFLQYLASGTPIAATDLPFLAEFKSQNLALAICKPDSVSEFVRCLSEAISKYPRKTEGYSQNMELAKNFTCEKRMERILERAGIA